MAFVSSRKTSIRYDYDNAGGDNLLFSKNKHSTFGDDSRLNVEMVERESVVGNQNSNERRYLGGLVGNKEIVAMALLAVSSYLVNGEYAQVVCTALTSVPPAVFSYRVLTSLQTSKEGYHTILFYWTLYGLFALADQFVGTAQGYNLCKGGLLGFVFLHAIRSNSPALPRSLQFLDQTSANLATTLFSRSAFEESIKNLGPRTPTITHFSDDDSEFMLQNSPSNDGVSTACSFSQSPQMQSTQNVTASTKKTHQGESSPFQNQKQPHPSNFETMSAMTRTCGASSDIVTVPSERITFSLDKREEMIQVTNISPFHVMFALKTNADTYLVAAPTSGILFSGQSMTVRVGVNDSFFKDHEDAGMFTDKLAIDYTSIPSSYSSSVTKFSQKFFQSQNRHRHAIRVFYQ